MLEYLHAVGDELPIYGESGIAPPLMLTAKVVGLLLDRLSLPDGAIHSLQDVETISPPRPRNGGGNPPRRLNRRGRGAD